MAKENNIQTGTESKIASAKLRNCPTSPRKMRLVADQIRGIDVNKALVSTLSEFFRAIWSLGNAGVEVPLNILRAGQLKSIIIGSGDRSKYYRSPRLH